MAYIYKIVNDVNQKVYIGKTYHTSIEQQYKEHCRDAFKEDEAQRPLYFAMRKYGIEHFHIELIEQTNTPEEREKYWIKYYNSFKDGYNATLGGDGRPYADYQLIQSLWNQNKTCGEIKDITHYDLETIRKALNEINVSKQERISRGHSSLSQKIVMLNDKNEILQIFSSYADANRFLGKDARCTNISQVCHGKRKTAYGYYWKIVN